MHLRRSPDGARQGYAAPPHSLNLSSAAASNRQNGAQLESTGHTGATPLRPFLSIVTRTQGTRLTTLAETLLSLAAQTCEDFELLLMAHKAAPENLRRVEALIAAQPDHLKDRTRLILVDHGGRTVPLNAGFEAADGDYAYILDDDDIIFGHCVETWKNLATANPGLVLRANVASQDVAIAATAHTACIGVAVYSPFAIGRPVFNLFAHLADNETPGLGMAFPLAAFRAGIRFDEELTTAEDWDLFMRMGLACGFASTTEILGIYRRWKGAANSLSVHPPEEWEANRRRVYAKLDLLPITLPPGSARLIRERADLQPLALPLGSEAASEIEQLRRDVEILFATTSWRITAPLRAVARRILFRPAPPPLDKLTRAELYCLKIDIRQSTSWRLAQALYKVRCRFRLKNT